MGHDRHELTSAAADPSQIRQAAEPSTADAREVFFPSLSPRVEMRSLVRIFMPENPSRKRRKAYLCSSSTLQHTSMTFESSYSGFRALV